MADASGLVTAIRGLMSLYEMADPVQLATYVSASTREGYHVVDVYNPDGSQGTRIEALGDVRAWPGVIVRVTKDRKKFGSNEWAIVGVDVESYTVSGTEPPSMLGLHGNDHGYNQIDEITNLHPFQIYPVRCQPYSGMTVQLLAGLYGPILGAYRQLDADTTFSLVSAEPVSKRRYVAIGLDEDANVTLTLGMPKAYLGVEDIPLTPGGQWAVAAVWLKAGDTEITRDRFRDLRFMQPTVHHLEAALAALSEELDIRFVRHLEGDY